MRKGKKLLGLLAATVMAASLCAGCSSYSDSEEKKGETKTAEVSETATPEATKAGNTKQIDKDKLKVGVVHIGDPADGSGYTYAHDQGIVEMQKNLALSDDQIIRKNNVSDSDPNAIETAIRELIEEGCNVIYGTSWGYMDTMEALAAEYPDIIFSHGTGNKNNGSNMNNYFGRIYQARYLSGIVAGMKTKSNLIGYVAAMGSDNSEVTGGIDAFAMGVYSVNKDAKVYVKVTNSWYSPEEETNAAKALLDEGCDVIAQHCDTPNPQLAAEAAGAFGIGYNSDMSKDAPKATLTSVIWNWGVYYTQATQAIIDGTWDCSNYFGGIKEGLDDISALNEDLVADGTKEAVEKAKAAMMDGSFNVFDGVIETNDGKTVGTEGSTLDDDTIKNKINWYFKNVTVK